MRGIIETQQRTTNSRDVYAALALTHSLTQLEQMIYLSSTLGDDHDRIAAKVTELRCVLYGRSRLGTRQKLVEQVLRAHASEYLTADDECARQQIRAQVSAHLRIELGPPTTAPSSVQRPVSMQPVSSWQGILDLALRVATKHGRPRKADDLPERAAVMQALLSAWELASNSIEAYKHARKPSSRRKKV